MRSTFILAASLCLAACGEPVRDDHFTNSVQPPAASPSPAGVASAVAVRVGELGPNFAACPTVGSTLRVAAGAQLPLRAAPFETGAEAGGIPAGARFFVCSRSIDQKWLGVVVHESGQLSDACGVSGPLPSRRAYDGPCRSGWVASALVRLIAGVEQPPVANPAEPRPAA